MGVTSGLQTPPETDSEASRSEADETDWASVDPKESIPATPDQETSSRRRTLDGTDEAFISQAVDGAELD